jgi:4-diphosphocytidyl-2-C-methyl-D-erythritol kinase
LLKKNFVLYIINKKIFNNIIGKLLRKGCKMESISLKAYAKINLSIDITGKRPDGYHDVKMIMQTIALHDIVTLEVRDSGIEIECNRPGIPTGADNIAYKAASLLMKEYNIDRGVCINITKNIPVAAGLAGGSADAAAVLKGMNSLFSLDLGEDELIAAGKQVGADVPFCIKGGTMLAQGIGEMLTELDFFSKVDIVLVKPGIEVSTAWVYKNLDLSRVSFRPDTNMLIKAISNKDTVLVAQNMKNVLESVTIEEYKAIKDIKEELIRLGALGSMMSGSGPSVFGIFEDRAKAEYAYERLKGEEWDCFLTETLCEER